MRKILISILNEDDAVRDGKWQHIEYRPASGEVPPTLKINGIVDGDCLDEALKPILAVIAARDEEKAAEAAMGLEADIEDL